MRNKELKVRKGRFNTWEKSIIRKLYPTRGARACLERFERLGYTRPVVNVQGKAHRMGIRFGEVDGHVRLSEVYGDDSKGRQWLTRLAEREGVLVRCGYTEVPEVGDVYLVPEGWAEEAAGRVGQMILAEDERLWMGTPEAASELGVQERTVTHALRGRNRVNLLESCLVKVPRIKDLRGYWRLRRYEFGLAAREYRARKARPKEREADGKWISRAA